MHAANTRQPEWLCSIYVQVLKDTSPHLTYHSGIPPDQNSPKC